MAYTTIDDPSVYFQIALYTGNGTQRNITNDGNSDLQPDWVWIKCRSAVEANMLYDSSRGVTKDLRSDTTAAENTNAQGLQAFNSDGFQIGTLQNVNFNTKTMVAWQWKANGGTTTTNDASSTSIGTVDSVIQANTEAGFSIVLFDLNGNTGGTVAHGLGAAPDLLILKNRENTASWNFMLPTALGTNKKLTLDSTSAASTNTEIFKNTAPTSTVFSFGNDDEFNSTATDQAIIAYCFAEKKGYSRIGSYVGNGNADGTFVYTGFKPAWIMIKRTSDGGNDWIIIDTTRFTFNLVDNYLRANTSDAETDQYAIDEDILSNGFKLRGTSGNINASGSVYIYMAFAERPFVTSEGTPTTAR